MQVRLMCSPPLPSRTAAFRAFELAREAGLPVIFDVDYRPYRRSYAALPAPPLLWPNPDVPLPCRH